MGKEPSIHSFKFKVLQEQVAGEDLFEDKTHDRVASTLNELICSTEQGLTIGLEGSWGSGKSTVIKLLKNKLDEAKTKTLFFVFDAWAHDGDPLRKIFLESLITSIDPEQNDTTLNNIKNEVSARKKTVEVKTTKSASKLGKIISAVALLIPVGAALLSTVKYEKLYMPWDNGATSINIAFLLGILFSFSPFIVLLGWRFWGEKDEDTNKIKWDIFQAQSTESYTQDVTEDGERTSIEFERFFKKILEYVFDEKSNYQFERTIIVVDNLDRVEFEYAQNVWSTLQTFFQHRTSSLNGVNEKWNQQLWFLIPHDREGIQRIWQAPLDKSNEPSNQDVSKSFMEKCFQICVEVPPSVMSTWISYFKDSVKNSFIDWPSEYKKEYINSYIQCMSKLEVSPSPRQIHTHINRAGILALQWKTEFSAESYCIYSLCRKDMCEKEFRKSLLSDGIPRNYPITKALKDIKPELAGLLFGVIPEKGMQLLLFPEILESMKEGDGNKLRSLYDVHKEALILILTASKDNWLPTEKHEDDYKLSVIEALHQGFLEEKHLIIQFIKAVEHLMVSTIKEWNLADYTFCDYIEYLINLSADQSTLLSNLEEGIRARIVACVSDEDFRSRELDSLEELENLLEKFNKPIMKKHYKKLDLDKWESWLNECDKQDVKLYSILPKKEVFQEIISNSLFDENNINEESFGLLTRTFALYSHLAAWKGLLNSLIEWFQLPNRNYNCNAVYDFAIQFLTDKTQSVKNKEELKKCVASPDFWIAGTHSGLENNPSLALLVVLSDSDFHSKGGVSDSIIEYFNTEFSEDTIKELYQNFKDSNGIETIWQLAIHQDNHFAKKILCNIKEPDLFETGASVVDEIEWENDNEIREIVQKLSANKAFLKIQSDVTKNPHEYSTVIHLFNTYGQPHDIEEITKILEKLSREDWKEALENKNELLKCIPPKTSNFAKAWEEYIEDIIKGECEGDQQENLLNTIALKDQVIDLNSIYVPKLTKVYFDTEGDISDEIFNIISELFTTQVGNVVQDKLEIRLSDWIENSNLDRIKWLISTGVQLTAPISETLEAEVTGKLKYSEGEDLELYKALNEKLELNISIQEELESDKKAEDELKEKESDN